MPLAASSAGSVINGTLGFLIVAGIFVAMIFLFRSMSKHLRKVNEAARQQELSESADPAQPGGPSVSP